MYPVEEERESIRPRAWCFSFYTCDEYVYVADTLFQAEGGMQCEYRFYPVETIADETKMPAVLHIHFNGGP